MNDKKLKHLEFIQNVITRMNTNSFVIKGWSVTLVSALFALAADKANLTFVLIAYLPVIVFWALDGFFLSQEKQYRELYNEVAAKKKGERGRDRVHCSGSAGFRFAGARAHLIPRQAGELAKSGRHPGTRAESPAAPR